MKWLLFSMVASSKPAHRMPHHRQVHPCPHPLIHLATFRPLTSAEDRRCLQNYSVSLHSVRFNSTSPQSSPQSCTCQSGLRAPHAAWVHRRWNLLEDKRKKAFIILLWGTKAHSEKKEPEETNRIYRIDQDFPTLGRGQVVRSPHVHSAHLVSTSVCSNSILYTNCLT